jgi:hypothetical protein
MPPHRYITHNGVTKTFSDWAHGLGISESALRRTINALGVEAALSRKYRKYTWHTVKNCKPQNQLPPPPRVVILYLNPWNGS